MLAARFPARLLPPAAVLALWLTAAPARAQTDFPTAAGVTIDAAGAFAVKFDRELGSKADAARRRALADANLPADLNRASEQRKVSLAKLEAALAERLEAGEEPTEAMRHLAGLSRIEQVFLVPAEGGRAGDVILAGPAAGFAPDAVGRVVSNETGRPVLSLADLLTVLRAGPLLGCSIDPVPERQAALARAAAQRRPSPSLRAAADVYRQLAAILGEQVVTVTGVPAGSSVGVTMVEADYRMKLIALGLEPSGVRRLPSHLSTLRPGGDSAQRWEFVPALDPVLTNADRTAFTLAGNRVRLLSRNELIAADGTRRDAGGVSESNEAWARLFSEQVPQLAEAKPTFAALQNVVDLAVLAELMRRERLAERAGWPAALFRDPAALPVPAGPAPRSVPTAFNTKTAGGSLVIGLIGGGVTIRPAAALAEAGVLNESTGQLDAARTAAVGDAADRWWWD